ncbi:MAG: hypothetical protein IKL07_06015 [Clostridium sp.]|nr:hypothetical protein [Clostridium sp.]
MMQRLDEAYWQTAKLIPSGRPIKILDLGCCTELEYDAFIQVNPEIEVTGIEEEEKLQEMLLHKSGRRIAKLRLIYGDYCDVDFGKEHYDMAMSVVENNKYDRKTRLQLYHKIFETLEEEGVYIERDVMPADLSVAGSMNNLFSKLVSLLLEAGFQRVERAWQNDNTLLIRAMK